jgi:hypothetical protein
MTALSTLNTEHLKLRIALKIEKALHTSEGMVTRVEMWRGGLGLAYLFPALSCAGASLT